MLQEDFEYRNWGLLDRTHIRFFGIKNIQALFENAGLKIVHAEFVVLQGDIAALDTGHKSNGHSRLNPADRTSSPQPCGHEKPPNGTSWVC